MRKVIVTVGPRASGKSSFCEKACALDPAIVWVSRDKVLIELFGKTSLDPYTGGHEYALERMWNIVEEKLQLASNITMILDTWNGSSRERVNINRKLREFGTNQIEAWYFVTPIEKVDEWFWNKPGIAKVGEMKVHQGAGLTFFSEDSPRRDYELFHNLASRINFDGFSEVVRINPVIMVPEHLLRFQTSLPP
ncbi:MAG: AAA family ATPase [bacterium]|nr:AAA family ATPase [bacterium]